jgi:CubicO group peptidase (beta-lactamase class C family)
LACSFHITAHANTEIDPGEIDAFIKREMKAGNIPGLALGIIKGDSVVYLKGFGSTGHGKGKVTPETSFIIGSVSKSFTGLAVMQLVERGVIDLNDPIKKYITWFSIGGSEASGKIKILQLLNHTSGIPAIAGNDSGIENSNTIEERIKVKNNTKLHHPVGSTYEYSSLNYDILGELIQVVSGQSYDEYINRNIFEPLEMTDSFASLGKTSKESLAVGYRPLFGFQIPVEIKYSMSALPSGYIISTAKDMTHYLTAFINLGRYRNNCILSMDGIIKSQSSFGHKGYGAGWFSSSYYKWHTGELANYNAYICTVPSEKLGIIMLSNTNDIGTKFLNHDCSSLRRIPDGIRIMLVGGQFPKETYLNTKRMYVFVDLVITLLLTFFIWVLFKTFEQSFDNKVACFIYLIRAGVALITPIVIFKGIPKWIHGSWTALFISVPDLTLSCVILSMILVTIGVASIVMILKVKWEHCLKLHTGLM